MEKAKKILTTCAIFVAAVVSLTPCLFAQEAPPEVITGEEKNVTSDSAILTGIVDPNGSDTLDVFMYGTTPGVYDRIAVIQSVSGSGNGTITSAGISDLIPGKMYYYKLVGQNSAGIAYANEGVLTTASTLTRSAAEMNVNSAVAKAAPTPTPTPPVVTTGAATAITGDCATLNGTVNPNGIPTFAGFQYGTTSGSYPYFTFVMSLLGGNSAIPVSADTCNLSPCTTYYYRIVASNSACGSVYGTAENSFTTPCETAVELASFVAQTNDDGGVTLAWETATEVDNAGFNIYRARRKDGDYTRINNALIASQGDGANGASYTYEDTPGRGTFYYKLEDVDYSGASAMHGLEKVRVRK